MLLALFALLMQPAATPPAPADPAYIAQQRDALTALTAAEGWKTTASGLKYRVLIGRGTGKRPKATDRVMVHYVASASGSNSPSPPTLLTAPDAARSRTERPCSSRWS
jgi:hypothetical protein